MTSRFAHANGIRLHYVEAGAGPLVLLLHGFPDFWYSWRFQMPALVAAGYRAVAVDLRGYNESQRPRGVASYRMDALTADVTALIDILGGESPVIVGHDWGGMIGWQLAMHDAWRVRGLVVLNAPHPQTFRRELLGWSSQKFRSWYAAAFQVPWLPEALLSVGDRALLERILSNGPARADDAVDAYMGAFAARGSLTAALNYYRAALRFPSAPPVPTPIRTLVLWGRQDPFLVPQLTHGLEPWVPQLTVQELPDAGHWLHHSHAADVAEHLLSFLRTMA